MALNLNEKKIPFGGQLGGTGLLIILLVVSLVLVIVYSREGDEGALHSLQSTTASVSSPLSSAGTATGSLAASASTSLEDLTADGQSMSQLKESNATLSQMVVELEEYRQEANRLESLIGIHDVYGFSSVAAHVTGYSSDSYNRIITIDVGTASGVKAGLPVMGSTGVVGQIVSTSTYSSEVRLLNDAQSGVAVMLQNSRAEGILSGSVEGVLYLQGVDESTDVKEGEAVITTGLGGGYFRGLVVGVVSKVEQRQGDATRTIVVSPNSSFSNISEVLVVLGMSNDAAASSDANAANAVVQAVGPDALLGNSSSSSDSSSNTSSSNSNSSDSSKSSSSSGSSGSSKSSSSSSEDGE
jgi:rod shape-determining protein MreC